MKLGFWQKWRSLLCSQYAQWDTSFETGLKLQIIENVEFLFIYFPCLFVFTFVFGTSIFKNIFEVYFPLGIFAKILLESIILFHKSYVKMYSIYGVCESNGLSGELVWLNLLIYIPILAAKNVYWSLKDFRLWEEFGCF